MNKKSKTRSEILNVAYDVFMRYGYTKTTLEDITREVGKGKSSIYYYFPSKEEVFMAMVESRINLMKEQVREVVAAQAGAREKLRSYVIGRMNGLIGLKNLYHCLTTEFRSREDFIKQIRQQTDQEEVSIVSSILNKGVSEGIFKLDDIYLTSTVFVTALKGMEMPLVLADDNDVGSLETRIDRLINVLFYGIIKR